MRTVLLLSLLSLTGCASWCNGRFFSDTLIWDSHPAVLAINGALVLTDVVTAVSCAPPFRKTVTPVVAPPAPEPVPDEPAPLTGAR